MISSHQNIGFISTRISGTDGVSLEIDKWSRVLEKNSFKCFYFAGELDRPDDVSFIAEKAHFNHPDIIKISKSIFGKQSRTYEITDLILQVKDELKDSIHRFIREFNINILIIENAVAIPMNIPLGLGITEVIEETDIKTIAHHHDFYWERERFSGNCAVDFLETAFPPKLKNIYHVTLNSIAAIDLKKRCGVDNTVIPNVFDFNDAPQKISKEKINSIRNAAGLNNEDTFILQPTRIIERKAIERSIDLVSKLNISNKKLILSHSFGDEGDGYFSMIKEYAFNKNVKLVDLSSRIGLTEKEEKFSLGDVYLTADFITYPSQYEGFGNAFLETVYYKKPFLINRYPVFGKDIEPLGFQCVKIDGEITPETVKEVEDILSGKKLYEICLEENYNIAKEHFSLDVLEILLVGMIYNQ